MLRYVINLNCFSSNKQKRQMEGKDKTQELLRFGPEVRAYLGRDIYWRGSCSQINLSILFNHLFSTEIYLGNAADNRKLFNSIPSAELVPLLTSSTDATMMIQSSAFCPPESTRILPITQNKLFSSEIKICVAI